MSDWRLRKMSRIEGPTMCTCIAAADSCTYLCRKCEIREEAGNCGVETGYCAESAFGMHTLNLCQSMHSGRAKVFQVLHAATVNHACILSCTSTTFKISKQRVLFVLLGQHQRLLHSLCRCSHNNLHKASWRLVGSFKYAASNQPDN